MTSFTSKFKSTPTYSFKFKTQTVTTPNRPQVFPSPQQYQNHAFEMSKSQTKSIKFSKSIRQVIIDKQKTNNPGPGAYENKSSINLNSFNKTEMKVRGQKRFLESQQITPDPTAYINNIKNDSVRYTFGKSTLSSFNRKLEKSPSPVTYDQNKIPMLRQSYSIGQSLRHSAVLNKTPGPGAYANDSKFLKVSFNQKKRIFSQAKRSNNFSNSDSPGPSQYIQKSFTQINCKNQKGFTWQKKGIYQISKTPGPADYKIQKQNYKFKDHHGYSIPKSSRSFSEKNKKQHTQSLAQYQLQPAIDRFKFKSINASKFSQSVKIFTTLNSNIKKIDFINPQKLQVNLLSSPKFTMGKSSRQSLVKLRGVEGADNFYHPKLNSILLNQGGHKIPKAQRMNLESKNKIGPGEYELDHKKDKKQFRFSKQRRITFLDRIVTEKVNVFKSQSFEPRQQFPNPPKYMNVKTKLKINETKIHH